MCMRVLLQGDFLIKDNTNFFFLQKKGARLDPCLF